MALNHVIYNYVVLLHDSAIMLHTVVKTASSTRLNHGKFIFMSIHVMCSFNEKMHILFLMVKTKVTSGNWSDTVVWITVFNAHNLSEMWFAMEKVTARPMK